MKTPKTDIYGRPITWHDKVEWWIEDHLGKILLCLMLLGIGCFFAGCASTKANSQKTLAGIQYAKDAALKTWGAYVAREQKRADALPDGQRQAAHAKLLERRLSVDDALRKFSAVWLAAWNAANYSQDAPATAPLIQSLTDLKLIATP
jgi:hypothetical protein